MPVSKVTDYDIVIKNLRGRKIPCFVTAVMKNKPDKDTSTGFDYERSCNTSSGKGSERKVSLQLTKVGRKRGLKSKQSLDMGAISLFTTKNEDFEKQALSGLSSQSKKQSKRSASGLDYESVLASTPEKLPKKRGRKSLSGVTSQPKKQSKLSFSNLDNKNVLDSAPEELSEKRGRKALSGLASQFKEHITISNSVIDNGSLLSSLPVQPLKKKGRKSTQGQQMPKKSIEEILDPDLNSDNAVAAPDSSDMIVYKKIHSKCIPPVPHNTPSNFMLRSDGDSTCTTSSLSQTSDFISHDPQQYFGQKTFFSLSVPTWDDESTCTSSTLSQDDVPTPWRKRRSRWYMNFSDPEEEEQVSEYELQRRKNIEENLKMLRQIFTEHGLQFEQKSSETPKPRKSYSKLPLPPPRPRSARIEIRRTSDNIDFSKLNNNTSVPALDVV